MNRAERRQAHLIEPLRRLAIIVRDLWVAAGLLILINTAAPALLTALGVTP